MRVLITGSAGFLGKSLADGFRTAGHETIGVDRHRVGGRTDMSYCIDILDRKALIDCLLELRPEGVVHLAARTDISRRARVTDYRENIEGVRNVIDAIAACGSVQRALFASSKTVHYDGYVPQSDTDFAPVNTYGESKVIGEKIVRETDGGGAVWCIIRPPTVWGPGVGPHYQRLFRMIERGWYVQVAGRTMTKSLAYIGNVVYQCLRLMDAPAEKVHRRVFYVGDYEEVNLGEFTEEFRKAFGAPPIRSIPQPVARAAAKIGDVINWIGLKSFPFNTFHLTNALTNYRLDLCRTEEVCGPLPYSLQAGVRETVRWMKSEGLV